MKFLYPVSQNAQIIDIGIRGGSDWSVVEENLSRCGAQVLFEWFLVCHRLDRLVRDLNSHPHFDCDTELTELFVEVLTTIEPGSTKCLIKIWHGVR